MQQSGKSQKDYTGWWKARLKSAHTDLYKILGNIKFILKIY